METGLEASGGRVVHVKDNVEGAVYIGRRNNRHKLEASPFENPYTIKAFGDRALAIVEYANDLTGGRKKYLLALLPDLRGKPLACWCRHDGAERTPGNSCHGDIILKLLEIHSDEELVAMSGVEDVEALREVMYGHE